MKRIGLGAFFTLLLSLAMPSYAYPPGQGSGTSSQEQPKKPQEPQPEPKPPRGQPQEPQPEAKPHQKEPKPPKSQEQQTPQPSNKQKSPDEKGGTSAQRQQVRPPGKSAHIPDPKFKASFGKQHTFAIQRVIPSTTTIVPNQTQFVFAGYTFIFVDPWPEDWLFTDDCFIDFVDEEYFLFDVAHPGIRVALFVVG